MWIKISHVILKYRIFFLIGILLITLFMVYMGRKAELSYDFKSAVPQDDEDMVFYNKFRSLFGDDGTLLVIGAKDERLFQLGFFNKWIALSNQIRQTRGVASVVSLPNLVYLAKDTAAKKFEVSSLFGKNIQSQYELDSILDFAWTLKFYEGKIFDQDNQTTVMLVSIDAAVMDSSYRQKLVEGILEMGETFQEETDIELRYAGLPFIRSHISKKVSAELTFLLILSGIATAIILYFFFNSLVAVVFPMLIIGIVVIWCLGFLGIFGFKVTILTGLLPPVLVVIGIPNCVYLLNKYHQEYRAHRNKIKALNRIIRRIGVVTLMTNTTTAIGFAVFILMSNPNLKQFGIISSICIMCTFVLSIILLPGFYSFLPPPTERELRHLDRTPLKRLLEFFHETIFYRKEWVYGVVLLLTILSIIGFSQVKNLSFMVDNIPEDSKPKQDLAFFEEHFRGVMPMEVMVDTRKKKGVMRSSTLKKVDDFTQSFKENEMVSSSLSVVNMVKASRQAYYNQDSSFYALPSNTEQPFILRYLQGGDDSLNREYLEMLVDSAGQKLRVSFQVADMGSIRLDSFINQVFRPRLQEYFPEERYDAQVTGTTLIFLKGNDYLVSSLKNSLLLAVVLIAILMAVLFASFRMILISITTNILPLLITAGLMGFFGVPLKPSTALVFSIAFGIAIDDSIHFLARYRRALMSNNYSVPEAIRTALSETGSGMVYTSIILFFGFIVFVYSDFDGTIALGYLTSTTLLVAMFANLILLPRLLLSLDSGKYSKFNFQLMEFYDENGVYEEDDEEIDLSQIRVNKAIEED